MSAAASLVRLATLQLLREQRQLVRVAQAARVVQAHKEADQAASHEVRSARQLLDRSLAGQTFCPDQMLLAGARLALAEQVSTCAEAALDDAQALNGAARTVLQQENARTDQLAAKAKAVRRQLIRKADDKRLADLQSLRAALSNGRRT